MTDLLDPPTEGPMSERDKELADRIYAAIQKAATHTERGEQAAEFRVGMSDLGYCSERTRRMLDHQVPDDTDMLLAWLGTVIGQGVEDALVKHLGTQVIVQAEVETPLRGEQGRVYNVMGHPDIVIPEDGLVLDGKTAYGLRLAERLGADQQKRYQRHGYGYGAWLAGMFGSLPLEDVRVGNIWLDRSGKEKRVHVETEPFDQEVLDDAARWLDEVVYAYQNKAEAQKEPPFEVCYNTCGFFSTCRGLDREGEGLIRDPWALEAVRMYTEGHELEKSGKAMKAESKANLMGVAGSTGTHTVRWVEVGEVKVKESVRAPHVRLDIKPIRL